MDTPSDLFEKLDDDLRSAVQDLGWTTPMPVQTKVIPLMRGDRDLIVQAQTGSGKTCRGCRGHGCGGCGLWLWSRPRLWLHP